MAVEDGRLQLKSLLSDTVKLLCKGSLKFVSSMSIEGLIGITLDNDDVLLVSLRELVSAEVSDASNSALLLTAADISNSSASSAAHYPLNQTEQHASATECMSSPSFCSGQQFCSENELVIGSVNSAVSHHNHNQNARRRPQRCPSNVIQLSSWQIKAEASSLDGENQVMNNNEDFQNNVEDYHLNDSNCLQADDNDIDLVVDGSCLVTIKDEPIIVEDDLLSDADYSGNVPGHWQHNRLLSKSTSSMSTAFPLTDQHLNAQPAADNDTDFPQNTPNMRGAKIRNASFVRTFQKGLNRCTICGRQTRSKASLEEHVKRHSNIYKYYCVYCKKGFSATVNLRAHVAKHTGVREFRCTECSADFLYNKDLKLHMINWHSS